jgi:hypothetical protein
MMHARTKVFLVGFVGAIALGTLVPAKAQYYPPPNYGPPPGYGYDYPPPRYGYRSYPGTRTAAHRATAYRVVTAHPTEVRLVEATTPARTRTAAHPVIAYRAVTARRIRDRMGLDRATITVEPQRKPRRDKSRGFFLA